MLSLGAKPLTAVAYFVKALDRVNDVDEHRSHLLDTLLQLAVSSGVVPKCLHVRGVSNVAQFPFASGGFGDVWRGEWEDRRVALKTVRAAILISQNDETIHRVREVLKYKLTRFSSRSYVLRGCARRFCFGDS